jgi:hypothetical protein
VAVAVEQQTAPVLAVVLVVQVDFQMLLVLMLVALALLDKVTPVELLIA